MSDPACPYCGELLSPRCLCWHPDDEEDDERFGVAYLRAQLARAEERGTAVVLAQSDAHAVLAEHDALRRALGEAAREINCAGPVAHRIRILKKSYAESRLAAKTTASILWGMLKESHFWGVYHGVPVPPSGELVLIDRAWYNRLRALAKNDPSRSA